MLHDGHHALVVDPGDAAPVLQALKAKRLQLSAILVTHHHQDHVGGVDALRDATGAVVYGPAGEDIPEPLIRLSGGDALNVLGVEFRVLDVPGHTAGHIAFFGTPAGESPLLFCGDTLFSGGCGRLFEGTPAQMLSSLDRLAELPGATRVCCAHEYTLSNLRFAQVVEPDNADLSRYKTECEALRARHEPTLPSTIAQERAINPFLRSRQPAVARAVHARSPSHNEVEVFAALREWKNKF